MTDRGTAPAADLAARLIQLNSEYARAIDDARFEAWPEMFFEDCLYMLTTADNHAAGMPAGLMYADSRGMLFDRISALREANIYERQRYRHIVGLPAVLSAADGRVRTEASFLVVRIMRDGRMDVFATGRYLDLVEADADGSLRFRERVVVCDSNRFDTLVAIPL
ncbi:MAG: aromatic-ring-hydroxylating dioxygenase subunit beta [Proteobacteria bacterium]|nr:aromatic-ring-hydroxylating dioxygenase subunit beta [Pseudomonadota bacterium]